MCDILLIDFLPSKKRDLPAEEMMGLKSLNHLTGFMIQQLVCVFFGGLGVALVEDVKGRMV